MDITGLKRTIAAQSDAERRGQGKQQPVSRLRALGYDLEKFSYPSDWDKWSDSWDAEPNPQLLARVLDARKINLGRATIDSVCKNGFASVDELTALSKLSAVLK